MKIAAAIIPTIIEPITNASIKTIGKNKESKILYLSLIIGTLLIFNLEVFTKMKIDINNKR